MHQSPQMGHGTGLQSPFAMEQMRRELEQTSQPIGRAPWVSEFADVAEGSRQLGGFKQAAHPLNPAEFAAYQQLRESHANGIGSESSNNQSSIPALSQSLGSRYGMGMGMGIGMGMGGMGIGMMPRPSFDRSAQQPNQAEGKGKGRLIELDEKDWEAQFAQMESTQSDLDRLDEEAAAAMETELSEADRLVFSETDHFGDFESFLYGIEAETANARQLVDGVQYEDEDHGQWDNFDGLNTHDSFRESHMGEYLFEEDNLFKDVTDPFREGMRIMEEGGNLSLAALAFEAAVQRDAEHVEAWTKLGAAQAQNEKESPAIRALEHALNLDPSNLEAMMGLAVSYTNEGYDATAYRTLERWLATKYPSVASGPLSSAAEVGFTDRLLLHEKVTDLFIAAAQLSPSGEAMDPDVQVGLGVLFYGAEEYDKAVDCFGAALASTESGTTNQHSQLHLLWNRLGATLANSGRSEEAINAYERALSLRPNFVRARYNLGVSCINLGCYEEAAQHLLGALAMHKVVEKEGKQRAREVVGDGVDDVQLDRLIHQNQSTNLFETLRRVFNQMGRRDLTEMVGQGMDVEAFRKEFEF